MKINERVLLAFLLGVFSILSQTILLRELFAVYGFSEILFTMLLFFWLFWGAIGSLTFKSGSPSGALAILVLLSVLIPLFVKITALFLRPELGVIVPVLRVVAAGAMCSFVAFFGGRAFAAISKGAKAGLLYACEGVGAFVAGIISMFLLTVLPSHWLMAIMAVPAALIILRAGFPKNSLIAFSSIAIAFAAQFLAPLFDSLLFPGFIVNFKESHYGRIASLSRGDETYIYENGHLICSNADTLSAEQIIHPVMWAHDSPKEVLLVGGLQFAALRDILKHNPNRVIVPFVDYPLLESMVANIPAIRSSIKDPRAEIVPSDPRTYLSRTTKKFDVIIVAPGFPQSGVDNRFWTVEFFEQLKSHVRVGGIVAVSLPVGMNFLSEYQSELAASVWKTFRKVFPDAQIYFPESHVLMVASAEKGFDFLKKLLGRKLRVINAATIRPEYLPLLYQRNRSETLIRQLASAYFARINRDWRPQAYLWGILQQAKLGGTKIPTKALSSGVARRFAEYFLILLFLIVILTRILGRSVFGWVFAGGVWGLGIQTLILLVFQANFGVLYWLIGLATGIFLLGSAVGSYLGEKINVNLTLLLVFLCVALTVLFAALGEAGFHIPLDVFVVMFFVAGCVSGLCFGGGSAVGGSGKMLYGMDLLGATLAAICGVYLIPMLAPTTIIIFVGGVVIIAGILAVTGKVLR